MTLLSRYITSIYLKILTLTVCSFTAIYLIIDFLEKLRRFSRTQGEPHYIVLYFLYKIPAIINQIMPLAVLMSTLLTLGILSRSSEIIAMQSCGISLKRIAKPLLVIAFVLSIFTFFSNEAIIPTTSQQQKYVDEVLIQGKSPSTFFRLNNIWFRDKNYILQARLFVPTTWTLKGITLWQTTEGMQPVKRLEAEEGVWNGQSWTLKNVVEKSFSSGKVTDTRKMSLLPVPLQLKVNDLKVWDKNADDMGFFKLKRYTEKLSKAGYDATRYQAQMYSKVSMPFACLIMAFVGIPFSLRSGRSSGVALGIGLSIGIGFAYFVINAILISLGGTGVLPPLVAAWAANFIFALSAIWMTLTMHH
ncbi:MAG: LPS export ABC transporter permease LptG [Deltaproteobacteria bacterium]|nr:LPS export ABC transporter permease LptG [Deltaproteobacteria bacterium]TLN04987.1 MAG: LPS export ABC transporter permease LptG [bacterium]